MLTLLQQRMMQILEHPERGDVPGWVLVTMMSAMIVVVLIGVATPLLSDLFTNAVNSVRDASP
ncbi:MAG: hypothetical protein QOG53_1204 [Frankiales bacterium]|jgi:hypothetical protein|nr:hypothetical protein [Frankiales bacterium]